MDEVIFEEFKRHRQHGSQPRPATCGSPHLPLDQHRAVWHAQEELLYHPDEYNTVVILRRALTGVPPVEAMELMLNKLKKTQSNIMFLLGMAVS